MLPNWNYLDADWRGPAAVFLPRPFDLFNTLPREVQDMRYMEFCAAVRNELLDRPLYSLQEWDEVVAYIDCVFFGSYKLNVWDVGGQKSLRSYWRNYFESTDGLIWVVDSADKRRLQDCAVELHKLLHEEKLAGATLLVFANKQDLPGALTAEEIRDVMNLNNIKTHHWIIIKSSAVTGENLLKGIDWLIDDIAARIFTLD
ncbi:ADP-ribosylation factor-like protein 2 [Nilaparvata lugens]|uniref:ADP-ribosylation factor-like protein 2 n=1 Tax=Nilaparvata lugens TaxID=108931 RepID=UPI00193E3DF9|nr:ADP-ribosylation factor-like protein 2 [Nilaparvata lugens]